ncbi:MAG: hypothetical protein V2I24_02395 [Halieaceae bacterium]|jgi:hypothetical protein|nr:hypothetical protein [Halieaceae bacterium]
MQLREASVPESVPDMERVRCEVSADLLCRLLRRGDLVAADLACLDAASALCLRRCVLESCRSNDEASQRCPATAARRRR